jgi:hypothetical protein
MSKHFITIADENLYNDIVEYCKLNNEKVNNFCQRILKEQLMIEKYGDTPFGKVVQEVVTSPVIPEDKKKQIQPHIDNMVENYSKIINNKIIEEMNQPEIVIAPYVLEEVTETITNGSINEKYKDKKVPKEFYGEIKVEEPKKKKIRRL